jgi:hypothetical protein
MRSVRLLAGCASVVLAVTVGGCDDDAGEAQPPGGEEPPGAPTVPTGDGGAATGGGGAATGGGGATGGGSIGTLPGGGTSGAACIPAFVATMVFPDAGLAADEQAIYFVRATSALAGVYRLARSGATLDRLAAVRSLEDDGFAWDLALRAADVVFVESGDVGVSPGAGAVRRVAKRGGPAVTLAVGETLPCRSAGHPLRVAAGGAIVAWIEDGGRRVFLDDQSGLPSCLSDAAIRRVRALFGAGPFVAPVSLGDTTTLAIAVDGESVFFLDATGLRRARAAEGVITLAPAVVGQQALAARAGVAYVGALDGTVRAVDAAGVVRLVWVPTSALPDADVRQIVPTARGLEVLMGTGRVLTIVAAGRARVAASPTTSVSSIAAAGDGALFGASGTDVVRLCP